MITINYTKFRSNLKQYLDEVEQNRETLMVKRGGGSGTVTLSLNEYNAIMETVHLLRSRTNADRLFESIQQMKQGETVTKGLIEGG